MRATTGLWVVCGGVVGLVVVGVGVATLGTDPTSLALVLPVVVLVAGLVWAIVGAPTEPSSSGAGWIVVGGVVGVAAIVAGLAVLGADLATLALLVPVVILLGGLMWSFGALQPATAAAATASGSVPVPSAAGGHVGGSPAARDVPTVLPVQEPDGETVSEAVRMDAARSFDLDRFRDDELADRVQCAECGRYDHLVRASQDSVSCTACGASRILGRVQPDTFVRMYVGRSDDPTPPDVPTVTRSVGQPIAPQTSTVPRGG